MYTATAPRLGWWATEVITTAIRQAFSAKAEARQLMRSRQESDRRVEWKALKAACAHGRDAIGTDANSHFNRFVTELELKIESRDQRGFYKHLKGTVGMEGTRVKEEQYIRDEMVYCCGIKGKFVVGW